MASATMHVALGLAMLVGPGFGAVPAQRRVPALSTKSLGQTTLLAPDNWFCDDDGNYCEGGGACCPDLTSSGDFGCAGDDAWANCQLFANSYCHGDSPIICDDYCCSPDEACRDGQCQPRSGLALVPGLVAASPAPLSFSRVLGPPKLGWWPSTWDGMLRTVQEGLHNQFLAVQAGAWRSDGPTYKPGQCFVVGFPADLADCDKPWDDGCRGSDATIVQDGKMTFYNNKPILSPVNYDNMDWCNDDLTQSQTHKQIYTYTETQSFETTLSSTIKTTIGMTSKTKFSESLLFESGSEEIDMSFKLEVDVTASNTQTTTKQKQWSSENTVNVGPRSHVYSTCWLSMGTLESPFDARVKIHSPVVWACTDPERGRDWWIYPQDQSLWQSFELESTMENTFGFAKDDLEAIFSAKFGGTWKGIVGQSVKCSTHTVQLKPGEMCHTRTSAAAGNLTIFL